MTKPDWDLLMVADSQDYDDHGWFPAIVRQVSDLISLEGLRFRNVYLTSRAIERGSANLFTVLYRSARLTGGSVLHISDYRESE